MKNKISFDIFLWNSSLFKDRNSTDPLRIVITGAAGQIAYSLIHQICTGDVFGNDQVRFAFFHCQIFIIYFIQSVILHLLDITPMLGVLQGVVMEIEDTSLPLVKGTIFYK
jgi:malate dehydrogenase